MKRAIIAAVFAAALAASPRPAAGDAAPRVVEITAKRWEFSPNEITLKKGEPVVLRLKSEDVTHGFFSRKLKIESDIQPGKTTDVPLTPEAAGAYTVICDVFCGSGHGNMKMKIVVE